MRWIPSIFLAFSIVTGLEGDNEPGFKVNIRRNPLSLFKAMVEGGDSVEQILRNKIVTYLADFELGTPGQRNTALIDTGSSDLWVFNEKSGMKPFYDASKSNTSVALNKDFSIRYVKGSARGKFFKDTLTMSGFKVKDFRFASVGANSHEHGSLGVFGIGQMAEISGPEKYVNFPQALKQQGHIQRVVYSLHLNNLDAANGTILFGAIDSSKFKGPLWRFPFISKKSLKVNFSVAGYHSRGTLDSGTSFTYLPEKIVNTIVAKYASANLTWDDRQGWYSSEQLPDPRVGGLTYSFSGAKITVPISELFIDVGPYYVFTVVPNSVSQYVVLLGDSTLRSAYVVYDLEKNECAIAQANYNTKAKPNIIPVVDEIPLAISAPGLHIGADPQTSA